MKQHCFLLLLLFLATSCQFFETEKVSTETIYKEELKTFDWSDVDQYPVFVECDSLDEKTAQKSCFEKALASHLCKTISNKHIVAIQSIYGDTVQINFSVSKKGKLAVENMQLDSLVQKEFPKLQDWLVQSIDSINLVAPAYKRGIPVATKFTLPIVFRTKE